MADAAAGAGEGPEIWFYQLQRSPLEAVLPDLIERSRGRGWRVAVRAADEDRLGELDDLLWTYRADSFLPHARAGAGETAVDPVVLTPAVENPNAAQALFILDGSALGDLDGVERCFIIFGGADETQLSGARARWKTLKASGGRLAYWRQGERGWERAD